MAHKIPIVFITDNNFIMQTSVAITSLIDNKCDSTIYDIYILSAECKEEDISILNQIDLKECLLHILPVSVEKYKDIKQCAHIPIACLLKFDICEIVRNYDKVIYLDGDIIVKSDLAEFYAYDLQKNCLGGVLEVTCIAEKDQRINAGILLMNLKALRDEKLNQVLIDTRKSLGDRGSMDQQTMNLVLKERITFLPVRYNCVVANYIGSQKINYSMQEINSLYGSNYKNIEELIEDSVIIHYATGFKPWIYTYAPCEGIWYDYYLKSPYGGKRIKRIGKIRSRANIFYKNIQDEGLIRGSKKTIERYLQKSDKNRKVDWG